MATEYLYDSRGAWIAFRRGKNIFDPHGEWAGWLPWDDDYVVAPDGTYLGTLFGDRLLRLDPPPRRGYPGYPLYPGSTSAPEAPGPVPPQPLPMDATDITTL